MFDDTERGGAGGFLTGLVCGALLGAGVALLFAPASGEKTRRILRRRARAFQHDAADGWVTAREEARRRLRRKKQALRDRLDQGLERIEERLDR